MKRDDRMLMALLGRGILMAVKVEYEYHKDDKERRDGMPGEGI
jgi:hypothetical protein